MIGIDSAKQADPFVATCGRVWSGQAVADGPRVSTRVPARLDVMGGIADAAGSLVLQAALPVEARIGVAPRTDQKVSITSVGWSNNGKQAEAVWPLSALYAAQGQLASPVEFAARFGESGCGWAIHSASVFHVLLEKNVLPHFAGGVSIVIESRIPAEAGIGSSAAISVGTALGVLALFDRSIEPMDVARLCERAERRIVGVPTGIAEKAAVLLARPGALLEMRCQPPETPSPLPLCPGTMIVGIDSGVRGEKRVQRLLEARVAAEMGARIVERLGRDEPAAGQRTRGFLANLSPSEYVERIRDRLPTKVRGREFLASYGALDDASAAIDPAATYKVRSRTEHHIYENDRVHRFAERLRRATRTGERDALIEAGELMYASHWSYSQRCGMGSIETDVLVNALREQGVAKGIYGAKVTSRGCGGTVAVLAADSPLAREAIEAACRAYKTRTSRVPAVYDGLAAGAALEPPRRLD